MLPAFLDHIEKFELCSKSDPILLAVSGGIDSVSMLYLFREAGYHVGVAHCNFQLRGQESDDDEQFVAAICKAFDIPVYVKRFETEAHAWENTLSTQMAARELRYTWFNELLKTHSYKRIATAHHFDDTMETILLNLIKGSGLDGFTGIPVRNGDVIRPLLFSSRKDIEQYALRKGIVWREDHSNNTDDYQRNFVRHHIIPKFKELNPSLENSWKTGLEKAKSEMNFLNHAYDEWKSIFVAISRDRAEISKEGLSRNQNASLLWRYIRTFGFNYDQSKEIIRALHGQPGKRFVSHTHNLAIDRDVLIITPRQQHWSEAIIDSDQPDASLGPWLLSVEKIETNDRIPSSQNVALFDASLLTFPLIWRKWKSGDYFYPLGLGHRKKLSDFFIDQKLSVADKDNVTIIECDGRIAWVAGYRIADQFKLGEKTSSAIKLTIRKG
ncbi:MAG: tRNA lysidine(34) synthetase TilS [Chryseolinea sp.]